MSEMSASAPVSVLIGTVPLFAVNRISLDERYELPPVGDKGLPQATAKVTRTVQVSAALIGDTRHLTRIMLEQMANFSKLMPLTPVLSGIPLVAGLTTLLDMQIDNLNFSQSADEKDVFLVNISLKHCPRPGLMALLSEATNAATAVVGTVKAVSSRPRKAM